MAQPDSVLILEDEGLVSILLEEIVRDMGARVVDVFATAREALKALASASYDCAILDVLVRDGSSMQVADALVERRIPFIFSSGVGIDAVDARHQCHRLISKPFDDEVLRRHLCELLARPRAAVA
ncbi:MAG TPA: response regulator [Devosia sp.]|nr:response regulator [Devosia sp.]